MSDLARFVEAQDRDDTYDRALAELRAGHKQSHWMWFVFPQIAGLGRSATARHFAIGSLEEARDYATHPVLGARLRECCAALLELSTHDPVEVFGSVDAVKLRSSMTLFARADGDAVHGRVLERFFDGMADPETLQRI